MNTKVLIFSFLTTVLAACGGGGGGGGGGSGATGTGIESAASLLRCNITLNQEDTDINEVLSTDCSKIFSETAKDDGKEWSINSQNTCDFVSINSSKFLAGKPNDDDVGTCLLYVQARLVNKITVYKATVQIDNIAPTLTVNDTSITEDAAMGIVKTNIEVASSEEGYGVYSLDNANTTGTKCSSNGSLSINSLTGEVQFAPASNYNGICNVMVRFDDGNSTNNIVSDEFSITVNAVNDAPVVSGSCSVGTIAQDVAYSCSSLSVSDSEVSDTQTWSFDATHTCAWASIASTTGVISGTPTDDQVGVCTLAVLSNDGNLDSNIYTKSITVTNVTPVISALSTVQAIAEDAAATVVILDADVVSSEEGFGVYSVDNANTTGTKCSDNGTVAINTANGEVTFAPAADYYGNCNIRVVFDDQNASGNTHFQEATIGVSSINDAAVITSACPTTANELTAYSCAGAFTDVESNPVTWSLNASNTCAWASINSTTGDITGTPTRAQVGSCDLIITANDGTVDTDRTYNLTVNNVAPSFTIADTSLAEDASITEIKADGDVASSDEGYGTYSIVTASANDCQSNGSVSINATTGAISFTPAADYDRTCNIKVQFDDGQPTNNLGTDEFAVVMIPSPDNAVVGLPAACDADVAEDVIYNCTPTITDPDTGDTHTWTIDTNTCAFISGITAATGVMSGTANDNQVGACTFTIKATGDQDALVTSTLTANFSVTNVQPVITGTNPITINMHHTTAPVEYAGVIKNTLSVFNTTSTDETYGVFAFGTPSSNPCSAVADTHTLNTATGEVSFLPNDKFVGTCKIALDFDDQNTTNNNAVTFEFDVNVVDQVPPVILNIDSITADGTYYLYQDVNVTVKFDEPVVVNTTSGSPRIFLETGVIDREAVYSSQSVDRTELIFTYTVGKDDLTTDLEVHNTVSYLDLAGATITDDSSNTLPNFAIPKPADTTGNSLSERRNLNIDGSVADAQLSGLPTLVSPDLVLDVTVAGGGVVEYQYKLKQVGSANDTCADPVGYSANIAVGTKITDSLVGFTLGSQIRICTVGVTAQSIVEPYVDAFEYVWSKDVNSVEKVNFGSINNLPNWQDSEIDPDNKNIVYARNLLGEIYKSIDYGATWNSQCNLPQTYNTSMEVSPGPDRTPYAFQDGTIYKIEDLDGGDCNDLLVGSGLSGDTKTTYGRRDVRFASNGDIYLVTNAFGGAQIYRSFDQGGNWSHYSTLSPVTYNDYFGFVLDPNDVSHILYTKLTGTVDPTQGLYESTDGGATYTKIGARRGPRLHWHPTNSNLVYSTYRAFSEKSLDGGTTWESAGESGSVYGTTFRDVRFDIDKITGIAYRLIISGSDTKLQKATDILSSGTVSWSDVYTFTSIVGRGIDSLNVSVAGNIGTPAEPSISVNILNRMWTSSDGGTTFTERFAPEELKLLTIAGSGDDAIYGATKDWFVVKTTDNGGSWTYKTGDYYHCLGKPPRLQVNQIDTDNILMWTENYGTVDCNNFNYSVDAMNSIVERNSFSMVAPKIAVAMSPYDPKKYYLGGKVTDEPFTFNRTSNSAFETTLKESAGNEFSDPMPDSFIHPHNDSVVWIADNTGSGILYEYDLDQGSRTDISARTGLTTIAGFDVYTGDKGQYFLRVMDRTGRMKVSSDYGATFSNEGTTGSPLTSCNKRFLYHHPKDRNLVVTACVEGNTVGISKDSGVSWDETNLLSEYTIDCELTGVAVSSSKMYLGCRKSDTMIFNYSFATLLNDVADSILTTVENGNANDLLVHIFPINYSSLEYAVIPANAVCDGTVTFSSTVPKSSDAGFTGRGEYKICIKQIDLASDTSYTTTSTIFYDDGSPVFTSIDLINDVADNELTYVEHYNNDLLVGNLSSSDHDFVKYAVVQSATTCDSSVVYSYEIPKSNNDIFTTNTTYKVCVELDTRGGAVQTYGQSANFTYVPTQVFATLSGVPEAYVSIDNALDITVGGTNVTQYKHKVILASNTCSDITGYSAATPIGTKISDDLTGFSSGDNLKLCVVAGDSSNYFQAVERATIHQWIYSTNYRIDPIDFGSVTTMTDWKQVAIHPGNENIIFALNNMGEVWKSEDKGSNWNLQCRTPAYRNAMHLKVSPGADATAYVSHHYVAGSTPTDYSYLYRVDDFNGADCTDLISTFRGVSESTFIHTSFAINSTGTIYHAENQYDSIVVRKSSDQGRNWIFVSQLLNSGLDGQITINPQNNSDMLLSTRTDNSGTGARGLYKSSNGGVSWSFVQATGFTGSQNMFYDPVVVNRVYGNNQYLSTDNGSTWSTNAEFDSSGGRWWVDGSGKGYRVEQVASDTVLYRSNTLNPASFTSHYIFSGIQSTNILTDQVSATANTIAVIIGKRMFVSTNAGVAFTEVFWPGRNLRLNGIASADGEKIYAVAKSWNVFSSGDAAENWNYHTQYFNQSCENDARVYNHHLDSDHVWIYSEGCHRRGIATSDGFASANYYGGGGTTSNSFGFFVNSTFPGRYMMAETYGAYGFMITNDNWSTNTNKDELTGYFSGYNQFEGPISYSKFDEPDTYLFIKSDNTLNEARTKNDIEIVNISSRLTFGTPATVAMDYDRDKLDLNHLVVSENGLLNISYDDGKTFSSIGTGSTGMATCGERLFYVYPNNNKMMVTACNGGTELAWTLNRGGSWTRLDLNSYFGMNCSLTGIVMNNSEIMFSCKSGFDGMRFFYTPANLLAGAKDNVLTAGEITGTAIVKVDFPSEYSNIEYTVINSGASCNAASPGFTTTVPLDSDISGLGDGAYQVCIKLDNGSVSYKTSTEILYKGSAPSFASIDLANEAVDGVQLTDYLEKSNLIVNNLVGSNYDIARYALVSAATTCDGSLNYSTAAPRSNSEYFTVEGTYKVCVALSDGVNTPAFGESSSFTFSKKQVFATLSGAPAKVSGDLVLNITVGGTNVDAYQYKVGASPLDCASSASYSSEILISTLITDNISGIADGNVDICVRGIDNTNQEDQLFYQATKYTWEKTNVTIDFAKFNANGFSRNWFDVEVAKWSGMAHIYARDFDGNIFLSIDRGVTFTSQCRVPHDSESRLIISNLIGHGAFATANNKLYRIDSLNGEECRDISTSFTSVVSTYQRAPVAFNNKGDIYVVDEVSPTQSDLYRSSTLGESWTLVKSFTENFKNVTVNIDPHTENIFLVYEGASTSFTNKYIISKNGGETFYGVKPSTPNKDVSLIQNIQIDFKFDPVNAGYLYANNGYYSSDNLDDLYDGTSNYVDDFSRWDIDNNGVGYRLVQNGSNIDFEKSNDMSIVSFSVDKSISSVTAGILNRTVSTSFDGSTVVVVADKQMFISLDNAAFIEVFTPVVKMEISSITSEDNSVAYVVDESWNFLKTTNSGTAWSYADSNSAGCSLAPRLRTSKANNNYVIAYAEDASGSCASGYSTKDGFASGQGITPSFTSATQPTLVMDPTDENAIAVIASQTIRSSSDFYTGVTQTTVTNISNNGHGYDGYMSNLDNNFLYNAVGGKLYEISLSGTSKTDITSSLVMSDPAAIEGFPDGSVYVMSRTGQIDISSNSAGSFSAYAANPALTSCSARFLKALASDPGNVIATGCAGGSRVAYTLDGGTSWAEINLADYSSTLSCSIRDIAIINDGTNKLFLACGGMEAITIEMD
ncbi:MAG: hypothetical protein ACJAS4_000961 [Bacteriovoracaceae bacterium]